MRTELVIEASKALQSIQTLQTAFEAIDKLKFQSLNAAFKAMSDSAKNMANEATKAQKESTKSQSEEEKKLRTLIQQRNKLIQDMQKAYSKDSNVVNTKEWGKQKENLVDLVRQVARMQEAIHGAKAAVKDLESALRMSGSSKHYNGLTEEFKQVYLRAKQANDMVKLLKQNASQELLAKSNAKRDAEQQAIQKSIERHNAKVAREREQALRYEQSVRLRLQQQQDAADRRRLQNVQRYYDQYQKILNTIQAHTGKDGLVFSQRGFQSMLRQIEALSRNIMNTLGVDLGRYLNRDLLNGVNVKNNVLPPGKTVDSIRERTSKLTIEAEKAFQNFAKIRDVASKVRLDVALSQLRQAQREEERMASALKGSESILKRISNLMANRAKWVMSGIYANKLWNLPQDIVDSYIDLERAMAGVQQVLPLIEGNAQETNAELERLIGISHEYGRSVQEVAEAAQLWGRGYGKAIISPLDDEATRYQKEMEAVEATNELVRQSAMLATVDNFGMAESVRGLEAVLAAYDMRARSAAEATLFAGRAVDIITKVSHTGQISAQELVAGLEATGKAAQQTGMSLAFLSAMIETGVRNTGKSGAEIGNAIKALTVGAHSNKGRKELEKFGIAIDKIGEDGKRRMRPLQDVILDIASALQTGDKNAEKMLLAISGGRYQYSKLSAVLRDEVEIVRMWGEATDSAGFAQRQLEVQINTIYVKLQRLKADLTQLFQDAINGDTGDFIKELIDGIDRALKALRGFESYASGLKYAVGIYAGIRAFATLSNSLRTVTGMYAALKTQIIASNAATAANAGMVARNSVASEALAIVKTKLSNAFGILTGKQIASNVATATGTAATAAHTVASTANTVAMNAEAAAATRLALAEAALTFGLNVIIGLAISGIAYWAMSTDAIEENTKAIDANTEVTQKNANAVSDRISEMEQEINAEEERADYIEKTGELYERLSKSIQKEGTETEKGTKLVEAQSRMREQFISTLSAEEAKIIEEEGISVESSKKIATAHREKVKSINADLTQLRANEKAYYESVMQDEESNIARYQASLDAFYDWKDAQIDGLTLWESAWAHAFKFVAGCLDWLSSAYGKIGDSLLEGAERMGNSPFGNNGMNKSTMQTAGSFFKSLSEKASSASDFFVDWSTETLNEKIEESKRKRIEAGAKIRELLNNSNRDLSSLYGTEGLDGGFLDDDDLGIKGSGGSGGSGSGGKGSSKELKELVSYTDEVSQAIHNMVLNGDFTGQGWNENRLKALAQYRSGENPSDLFALTEAMEKYLPNGHDKSNPFANAYAFQQWALNEGAKGNGWEGALESLYQSGYTSVIEQINNDAKYYEEHLDWHNQNNARVYGEKVSNIQEKLQKGLDKWVGESMDLAGVGCVEAAEKIGLEYSDFLQEEFDNGVRRVDTLLDDARAKGIGVIDFDESQLELGDLVTWANPGDYNNHVGVFIGYRDGVPYTADNSSNANEVMERPLYRRWQNEESIVKTGSSAGIPWANSKKSTSIYDWSGDIRGRTLAKEKEMGDALEREYRLAVERAEMEKEYTGDTSAYHDAVQSLRKLHIKSLEDFIRRFRSSYENRQKELDSYVGSNKTIQAALGRAGVSSFQELSLEEQKDLLAQNAKSGDETAKRAEKIYEWLQSNKYTLTEKQSQLEKERLESHKDIGHMTPEEAYKYKRKKISDQDDEYHDDKLLKAKQLLELDILELQRLQGEVQKQTIRDERTKVELLAEQKELRAQIASLSSTPEDAERNNLVIADLNKQLERSIQNYRDIGEYGSAQLRKVEEAARGLEKTVKESAKKVKEVADEYKKAGADVTTDFFDKLINGGSSLKDALEDLRKEIARIALKWFTYKLFGLPTDQTTFGNSPLEMLLVHSQNRRSSGIDPMGAGGNMMGMGMRSMTPMQTNPSMMGMNGTQPGMNPVGNMGTAVGGGNLAGAMQNLNNTLTSTVTPAVTNAGTAMTTMTPAITTMGTAIPTTNATLTAVETAEMASQAATLVNNAATTTDTAATTANSTTTTANTVSEGANTTAVGANTAAIFQLIPALAMAGAGGGGGGGGILSTIFSVVSSAFGAKSGGYIPGFASGGSGLIRGAGTGTSDSILTYLENQGRFIRTSDGEFIMNAKATNKIGADNLDVLNKNPELWNEFLFGKKFATGGATEMVPSMRKTTPNVYRSYVSTKASMSNPNARLEGLMEEQTNTIRGLSDRNNNGKLVILNTQADSTSVMKAIRENPRMFRSLLGQQDRKRGFR